MAFELLKNKVKLEFTTNGNSKIKFHRFTVSTYVCDITKFVKVKKCINSIYYRTHFIVSKWLSKETPVEHNMKYNWK